MQRLSRHDDTYVQLQRMLRGEGKGTLGNSDSTDVSSNSVHVRTGSPTAVRCEWTVNRPVDGDNHEVQAKEDTNAVDSGSRTSIDEDVHTDKEAGTGKATGNR